MLTIDYRNAVFTFIVQSSFSGTIKFYGSDQEARPDFTTSASATNVYSPTQVINLADGTSIAGNTGFVATGSSDGIYTFEVNENLNRWIGAICTDYSAGDVIVTLSLSNNQ